MEKGVDTLLNIKAFLATARAGKLFGRSARAGRRPLGDRQAHQPPRGPDARAAVRALDAQAVADGHRRALLSALPDHRQRGRERDQRRCVGDRPDRGPVCAIKCPTTFAMLNFGEILNDFQVAHPGIVIDLAADRPLGQPGGRGFRHRHRRDACVLRQRDRRAAVALPARPVRGAVLSRGAWRAEAPDRPDRPRLPDAARRPVRPGRSKARAG